MCGESGSTLIFVIEDTVKRTEDSAYHTTVTNVIINKSSLTIGFFNAPILPPVTNCLPGSSTGSCVVVFFIDLFIVGVDGFVLDSD